MKNKALHYILPVFAALAAISCVKEDLTQDAMQIRLKSGVCSSPVATKATEIYDYNTDEALPVSILRWDEGESATHAGKKYLSATMDRPDPTDGWKREIIFETSQYYKDRTSKIGFKGVYPRITEKAWAVNSDGSLTYDIDGNTDVMVSEGRTGTYNDGIPVLPFAHGLCHFRIYAYAVDDESKLHWGNITSVILQNLPDKLQVAFEPDEIGNGIPVFTYSDNAGGTTDKELVETGTSIELGSSYDTKVLLGEMLAGAPTKGMIGVAVTSETYSGVDGNPLGNSVSIARNFRPGYTYNIVLRFSEHGKINAVLTVEDWKYDKINYESKQDTDLYTDLSYNGTSNCYVVSTANLGYCFNATVKGNGVNRFSDYRGNEFILPDENVNLDIDYVAISGQYGSLKYNTATKKYDVVAPEDQAKADMIELVSPYITNGLVRFKVKGIEDGNYTLPYKGNARINAFKDGKIVWSWHIWVTDKPKDKIYRNGYVSMDRNLGAVSSDHYDYDANTNTVNGICYQFGRKDPMFRYLLENHHDEYTRNQDVSVAEAHANPRVYYYSDKNDWTSENSDHFWGYASAREGAHKTIYDPCPPGYKVPARAVFDYVVADAQTVTATHDGTEDTGFTITTTIDEVYYPKSFLIARGGYTRDNDDFTQDKLSLGINSSYLYTATPVPNSEFAYHFSFDLAQYNANPAAYEALVANINHGGRRANAFPVRCVKESSGLAATDLSKYQSANSYIVSGAGYYTFDATVRGNGLAGLNSLVSNNFTSFDAGMGSTISGVDHVGLLWWQGDLTKGSDFMTFAAGTHTDEEIEDRCPVIIIDDGKPNEKGDVMFYVNDLRPANVGLAAYDQNNRILWSWHIWINPDLKVVQFGDYGVLNAQLGATYIPAQSSDVTKDNIDATYGFYYQWGRKDPMFQKDQPRYIKERNGTWTRTTALTTAPANMVPQSVEEPTVFYTSNGSFWQTTYTNTEVISHFWGYAGTTNTGDSFLKTMWDPCPPGYKLIDHKNFSSAAMGHHDAGGGQSYYSNLSGTTYNSLGLFVKPGVKSNYNRDSNSTGNGTYNVIVGDAGLWFPHGGYITRDGSSYNYQGTNGYTTCACPMGYNGFRFFETKYENYIYQVGDMNRYEQGRAMSARCLKE